MQCIFFLLGLFVGSFLNVLADRLPNGEDVLWSRSRCDFCKKTLRWYELFPIISFFIQKGRCRRCGKKLSFQYPIVELGTAIGFAMLYTHPVWLIIFSACAVIFISDCKYQIIPDSMIGILTIGSFLWIGLSQPNVVAGILSALLFYSMWAFTRGRGMGFGDVKLAGALGYLLGFPMIVFALYGAFLTGAVVGVILIAVRSKTLKSKIAFGPFLIFGTAIAIVFNKQLLGIWQKIF